MATNIEEPIARTAVTIDQILDIIDAAYVRIDSLLDDLDPYLDSTVYAGEWNPRRILSHIIGAWQRVPVHAAFFLDTSSAGEVPMQLHNDYWIEEWATAPIAAFRTALKATYLGNLHFVSELDPADLDRTAVTPFGEWTLAELFVVCYNNHIYSTHAAQLEAFVNR
ncbi:MAG: DinB family protein [Chloroflexota bacterium]